MTEKTRVIKNQRIKAGKFVLLTPITRRLNAKKNVRRSKTPQKNRSQKAKTQGVLRTLAPPLIKN